MMEEILEELIVLIVLKYFYNNENLFLLLKKIWKTLKKSSERNQNYS